MGCPLVEVTVTVAKKKPKTKPVVSHSPTYIQYKGKVLELFPFQAILLSPMAKAFGKLMPTNGIIERGYAEVKQPPHSAISFLLPSEMPHLGQKLRGIGLTIKHVEGTGYILTESNGQHPPKSA